MAAGATYVRVLGPFELAHDDQIVAVDGRVGQAILAALASRPDTKVLPAQLIRMVWADPDVISVETLYHHVTRLRRALAPTGLTIVGHRPGYRLPVTVEQVDLAQFDDLLRTARTLSDTDPDEAVRRLRAALALWRGPYAVDALTLPGIRRLAAGWQARRLDAEEDLAEIDLRRGRPDQVLDRLHTLAAAYPDRPRLAAALVRALVLTGRADQARTVLTDAERTARRIGQPPHPSLVQARQALHRTGSGGDASTAPDRVASAPIVPFQLPADTVRFTGRAEYLARLLDLHPGPDGTSGPTVAAVQGMAGIGKTALAVHAAHQLADRFPDGVLFTDLCGFTPEVEPTSSCDALDHLLRGLGVPGAQIPPDLDARIGLYRSILARRRVLIVLDNAAHETQLTPLLPGTPGCRAIVTSRRRLASLDDAIHITLPMLDPVEAVDLFSGVAGDRVTPADLATIERIVALCGRLPLAIRIAAARLRYAPAGNPAVLCAELEGALDTGSSLEWLSDGHRAVAGALAVSYQHLTAGQQDALRLASLHPGPSLEPYALAALTDTKVDHAHQMLEQLHAASLLHQPTYRRYTLHDLVATYATTLATELPDGDRNAALERLYDHYAATSSRAMNLTYPWQTGHRPAPPASRTPGPVLVDPEQAQAWLNTETDNVLEAAHHAAAHHVLHQSAVLHWHLRSRGHYTQAAMLHQQALRHAQATADPTAEHDALIDLGDINRLQGRCGPAAECYERALAIARQTGHPFGEQQALCGLGDVLWFQSRHRQAADYYEQALAIARRIGHRSGELQALNGLGDVHYAQGRPGPAADFYEHALAIARRIGHYVGELEALRGLGNGHYLQARYGPALDCYQQALAIARRIGHRSGEQTALNGLGHVHHARGRYESAADCFQQALGIARETGHRFGECGALRGLGDGHYRQGRYGPAADCYAQALAITRETDDRNGQCEAHQGLGRVDLATHHLRDALRHHEVALQLAVDLGQPTDQARAHDGLAHTHLALGNTSRARHHWQVAMELLTRSGIDHTEDPDVTTATIRTHLRDLGAPSPTG